MATIEKCTSCGHVGRSEWVDVCDNCGKQQLDLTQVRRGSVRVMVNGTDCQKNVVACSAACFQQAAYEAYDGIVTEGLASVARAHR